MKRGDRFYADTSACSIQVIRVARDGSWADIFVMPDGGFVGWSKRQRLLPSGQFPFSVVAAGGRVSS